MSADYPAAQDHLVPRSFMFNSNTPVAVVIHKTGGDATPQAVYNTFINSSDHKSSHYAIGQDGSIWQFVPESLGAGANGIPGPQMEAFWQPYLKQYGNLNMCTISIEHCDPSSANDTPLTDAQKAASFNLVKHICAKHKIPADHIKPHRSIAATTCPGNYPMDELINFVKSGSGGTNDDMLDLSNGWVKAYFRETSTSPHRWMCDKTGFAIWAGVLDGWRRMNGAPRLPIGPETSCGKRAVYQKHEAGVMVWDPDHELDNPGGPWGDCYLLKYDSDLGKKLLGTDAPPTPSIDLTDVIANAKELGSDLADAANKASLILKDLGVSG